MRLSPRAILFLAMSSGGSGYLLASGTTGIAPNTGYADLVEKSVPGVVRIMTNKVYAAPNGPVSIGFQPSSARKRVSSEGSGVILTADGYIVTNAHVIENSVSTRVQLHDGREFDATIVAADGPIDLAVLKLNGTVRDLTPLTFGDSAKVRVGEPVLAIGNPFGVGTTVTQGIVSAMSPSKLGIAGDEDFIQTDAAVNPGNSGGALINTSGELIGINTAILSTSGGSNGIGFALPANVAKSVVAELLQNGSVKRGYLGIGLQPITPDLVEALGEENGALISDVAPESPAAKAGLQKGDVVAGMNGRTVRDFNRLRLFIAEAKPGVAIQLLIRREGLEKNFWIVLEERGSVAATAATGRAVDDVTVPGLAVSDGPAGSGVLVLAVAEGNEAVAGLRAGDVIVAANRKPVTSTTALSEALRTNGSAAVLLEVSRLGSSYFVGLRKN